MKEEGEKVEVIVKEQVVKEMLGEMAEVEMVREMEEVEVANHTTCSRGVITYQKWVWLCMDSAQSSNI